MVKDTQITQHRQTITRSDRERFNGHQGCVIWFTGLSGSGKSTIANLVDQKLYQLGVHSVILDGDNLRFTLNASPKTLLENYGQGFAERFGLGFDRADRDENIRRIGAVAQLFSSAGVITLAAAVSPYRASRELVRGLVESRGQPGDFVEVYVNTPLHLCKQRDPKGLYQLAEKGKLTGMTGVDDPYEPPPSPEITLESASAGAEEFAEEMIAYLKKVGKINS